MQEVQALCDRVLIINNGQLVANDTIDQLQHRMVGETLVRVEFKEQVKKEELLKIAQVRKVKTLKNNEWQLICEGTEDVRASIFAFAVDRGYTLLEMQREKYSVEDVFQKLTKN